MALLCGRHCAGHCPVDSSSNLRDEPVRCARGLPPTSGPLRADASREEEEDSRKYVMGNLERTWDGTWVAQPLGEVPSSGSRRHETRGLDVPTASHHGAGREWALRLGE